MAPQSVSDFAAKFYYVPRVLLVRATTEFQIDTLNHQYTSASTDGHLQTFQSVIDKHQTEVETCWRLPTTDSETLESFVYWLYHDSIPFIELDTEWMDTEAYLVASRLWIFGERFQIPRIQNIAMSRLYACKENSSYAPIVIDEVFHDTEAGSALQRFLAIEAVLTWAPADLGDPDYEALLPLAQEYLQSRLRQNPQDDNEFMVIKGE